MQVVVAGVGVDGVECCSGCTVVRGAAVGKQLQQASIAVVSIV